MDLLTVNNNGIYCPLADVYMDPWNPVGRALITHAHADHARPGHGSYLCQHLAKPYLSYRLNEAKNIDSLEYDEKITINGVKFSFHPAGHIPGSSQIRVEYKGEIWVFSGDYKLANDGLSRPFEPVICHTFITESTFGLPIFNWEPQGQIFQEVNQWWKQNQEQGESSVLIGYSLGKAQRILLNIDPEIGRIYTHGAVENTNEIARQQGINLPSTMRVTPETSKQEIIGSLVICPPSAAGSSWLKKFTPYSLGLASGWMGLRGARRRRAIDRGFILSDHADWGGLNEAVKATGAERIICTHGYNTIFSRWLSENGYEAMAIETLYQGELAEINESSTNIDSGT